MPTDGSSLKLVSYSLNIQYTFNPQKLSSLLDNGGTHQEIANFVTNQLKLHWATDASGNKYEYMVYVNDAAGEANHDITS